MLEADGLLLFATSSDFPVLCNGVFRIDDRVPAATTLDRRRRVVRATSAAATR